MAALSYLRSMRVVLTELCERHVGRASDPNGVFVIFDFTAACAEGKEIVAARSCESTPTRDVEPLLTAIAILAARLQTRAFRRRTCWKRTIARLSREPTAETRNHSSKFSAPSSIRG